MPIVGTLGKNISPLDIVSPLPRQTSDSASQNNVATGGGTGSASGPIGPLNLISGFQNSPTNN